LRRRGHSRHRSHDRRAHARVLRRDGQGRGDQAHRRHPEVLHHPVRQQEGGARAEAAAVSEGAVVALRGVGKTLRNGTRALDGLDLEVQRGEFLTVLGPSACGSSSALRVIPGLSGPAPALAEVSERVTGVVEWSAAPTDPSRRIGFVFQEPTLMPWATVADNVRLPLRLGGLLTEQTEALVARALEQVGLEGFGDVYPRELSG